jgi:hypothetical protein
MPACAMGWAFKQKAKSTEKLILIMLANCSDQDGFGSISVDNICDLCGMSEYRFRKAIVQLEKKPSLLGCSLDGQTFKYQLNWNMSDVFSGN